MKVYLNMMTKSEPVAWAGILSVAPFVEKCIIHDTGSEPQWLDLLYKTKDFFPNIEITERKIPDAHGWVQSDLHRTVNKEAAPLLGDIRREQQRISLEEGADFIWIVDGDECYPKSTALKVRELIDHNLHGKISLHLPFIDFIHSFEYLRWDHYMGRIMSTTKTELIGEYPTEMNHSKITGRCLESGLDECMTLQRTNDSECVHHLESLVKPHRKSLYVKRKYEGTLPEVLTNPDYAEFHKITNRWRV